MPERKVNSVSDYTEYPLGPLASGRIGEIVECPNCHKHALKVEDYKDLNSKEKESIYIHSEAELLLRRTVENGRTVETYETRENVCRIRPKPVAS
jgi:hypothetical protein